MRRLALRWSWFGFAVAGVFFAGFLCLLIWVYFVASRNPADSGESAILLLPFAMPWVMWLPHSLVSPWTGLASVLANTLILYGVFGGLRFRGRAE